MAYHCTICGSVFGAFNAPKDKAKFGKEKGRVIPLHCGKKLRKISSKVAKQIREEHGE